MDLILKRKSDTSDFDPLLILIEADQDDQGPKKNFMTKIALGETLSVSDDIAYRIMAKYKNLFEIVQKEVKYETKTMKAKE